MDGSDKTETIKWPSVQVYSLAVVCLLMGAAAGYFLRGSVAPAGAPLANVAKATAHAAMPEGMNMQPTPEQLKHMADKTAEPLLASLQSNPNDADLLAKIGSVYFRGQQFSIATDYFDRAAKAKPTAERLVSLSNSYHYAGADDRAIETLNRALQIDPKSANALVNLGLLKWQVKNDPKGAIELFQRMLKSNPQHARRAQVEEMIARAQEQMTMSAGAKGE